MFDLPKIPLAHWIDAFVAWISHFEGFFYVITNALGGIINAIHLFDAPNAQKVAPAQPFFQKRDYSTQK